MSRLFSWFGTEERRPRQSGPGFTPCSCSIIQAQLITQNVAVGKSLLLKPLQFNNEKNAHCVDKHLKQTRT